MSVWSGFLNTLGSSASSFLTPVSAIAGLPGTGWLTSACTHSWASSTTKEVGEEQKIKHPDSVLWCGRGETPGRSSSVSQHDCCFYQTFLSMVSIRYYPDEYCELSIFLIFSCPQNENSYNLPQEMHWGLKKPEWAAWSQSLGRSSAQGVMPDAMISNRAPSSVSGFCPALLSDFSSLWSL